MLERHPIFLKTDLVVIRSFEGSPCVTAYDLAMALNIEPAAIQSWVSGLTNFFGPGERIKVSVADDIEFVFLTVPATIRVCRFWHANPLAGSLADHLDQLLDSWTNTPRPTQVPWPEHASGLAVLDYQNDSRVGNQGVSDSGLPTRNAVKADVSHFETPSRGGVTTSVIPTIFYFEGHVVRTVTVDGEPWWVAKDVRDVLSLANYKTSLALLDDDEKGTAIVRTPIGSQVMATINEPGLYSLILRSRKPEAKAFKRWVVHEALPSMRKTGTYSVKPVEEVSAASVLQAVASGIGVLRQDITAIQEKVGQEISDLRKQVQAADPEVLTARAVVDLEALQIKKIALHKQLVAMVRNTVTTAKQIGPADPRYQVAFSLNHYSKAWSKVHGHVGVTRIDDYVTVPQLERGIDLAHALLASLAP